ncbi:MAG: thioredoxin domain-containing protein [bacterium]|nr:thioredoxin domain-containing protein [bacterium]
MRRAFFAVLIIAGAAALWAMRPPTRTTPDAPQLPRTAAAPTVAGDDLILGPRNAAHTIVEFGDYACPACADIQRVLDGILESRNDVRVVWKDLPHLAGVAQSLPRHVAARCAARQDAFPAFHRALFEQQPRTDAEITALATQLGLNMTAFATCQRDPSITARIRANEQEAARVGVTGTPEFFVDGKRLEATPTPGAFDTVLKNLR